MEAVTITCDTNDLIKLLFHKVKDFEKYRELQCEKNQDVAQQLKNLTEAAEKLTDVVIEIVKDMDSLYDRRTP